MPCVIVLFGDGFGDRLLLVVVIASPSCSVDETLGISSDAQRIGY